MAKTVTATEAKNRFGALAQEVRRTEQPVIVELRGRPEVAIITAEQLEDFEALKNKRRGQEALAELRAIQASAGGRNKDLSEQEADEIINKAIREVRRDLIEQGILVFEQD